MYRPGCMADIAAPCKPAVEKAQRDVARRQKPSALQSVADCYLFVMTDSPKWGTAVKIDLECG